MICFSGDSPQEQQTAVWILPLSNAFDPVKLGHSVCVYWIGLDPQPVSRLGWKQEEGWDNKSGSEWLV